MFKKLLVLICLWGLVELQAMGQALDFANTEYYTTTGTKLVARGSNLSAFSFNNPASAAHPLRGNGVYYPIKDFANKNLWVRVRHLQADPNGTAVGFNVGETQNSPFRSGGFGGWWGFLYQFDIYADSVATGTPSNKLGLLTPNNILVESIETLSQPEWLSFRILNRGSTGWFLQTKNLGSAPGSNPGFSDSLNYYPSGPLSPAYRPTFPNGADSVYALDLGGSNYAEFRMGANGVSSFLYGYEYNQGFGYQGMTLSFGQPAAVATKPNQTTLLAHPNPTTGLVKLSSSAHGVVRNMLGQEVLRFAGKEIVLEGLPAGLYVLQADGHVPVRVQKE